MNKEIQLLIERPLGLQMKELLNLWPVSLLKFIKKVSYLSLFFLSSWNLLINLQAWNKCVLYSCFFLVVFSSYYRIFPDKHTSHS